MMKVIARASAAVTTLDTSDTVNLAYVDTGAVQVNVTNGSTPNGSVKLQSSNDGSNWVDISGATFAITTEADTMFHLSDIGYEFIRAHYTVTSGTFDSEVIVTGKERNV